MKKIFSAIALASVCLSCSVLEPTVDTTRFYILNSGDLNTPSDPATDGAILLALGPVYLPAYLDNPWIAVRENDVEIKYATSHQWGEVLEQGIQRTLRDNLEQLIGAPDITVMQQTRRSEGRYVVTLDFSRFELTESGAAVVKAGWRISGGPVAQFEHTGKFETSVDYDKTDGGYSAGVEALSSALAELSQELATALAEI